MSVILLVALALTASGCGVSIKPAPASGAGNGSPTASGSSATPLVVASPDPTTASNATTSPSVTASSIAKATATTAAKPSATRTVPTPTPALASVPTSTAGSGAVQPTAEANVAPAQDPEQEPPNSQPPPSSLSSAGGQSTSKPLPTPTPVHKPTSVPTSPAPSPTPTTSGLPSCQSDPVRGFGLAWHDYPALANAIGCPLGPEIGLPAKVQAYQHGLMIWLDLQANASNVDSESWVVTLAGTTANRTRISDDGLSWQDGDVTPSGAFAWVYQNVYTDADRLGSPSGPLGSSDAAIEQFEHGTMIWLRNPLSSSSSQPMIYVIESNLATDASGSFQVVPDKSFE